MRLTARLDAGPILERLGLSRDEITRNVLLLACLTLFTDCTDPKGGDGQDSNVNSGGIVVTPNE